MWISQRPLWWLVRKACRETELKALCHVRRGDTAPCWRDEGGATTPQLIQVWFTQRILISPLLSFLYVTPSSPLLSLRYFLLSSPFLTLLPPLLSSPFLTLLSPLLILLPPLLSSPQVTISILKLTYLCKSIEHNTFHYILILFLFPYF